jgi:ATP-dependent protease ClpP protease subunit
MSQPTLAARRTGAALHLYAYDWVEDHPEMGVGAAMFRDALAADDAAEVVVHVNSPGGNAFEGVAIYNILAASGRRVTTIADGIAASAASLVFMAGAERVIMPGAAVMIHDLSQMAYGNADEMVKTAERLDVLSDLYADIYASRAGKAREEMREYMRAETWFGPTEAVAVGLATKIGGASEEPAEEAEPPVLVAAAWGRRAPVYTWQNAPAAVAALHPQFVRPAETPAPLAASASNPRKEAAVMAEPTVATPALAAASPIPVVRSAADIAELRIFAAAAGVDAAATLDAIQSERATAEIKAAWQAQFSARRDDSATPRAAALGGESNQIRSIVDAIPHALAIRAGAIRADGSPVKRVHNGVAAQPEAAPHLATPIVLAPRAAELSGLSLVEMLRVYIHACGGNTIGKRPQEILQMASRASFRAAGYNTTADFPVLLENALNKVLAIRYATAPATWRAISRVIPANDLRPHLLNKQSGVSRLGVVNEAGEVRTRNLPDSRKETLTPQEFGGIVSLTDAMMINDDLNALSDMANMLADAAAFTVNERVWYRILKNATMLEDSVALYDAGHNNALSSTVVEVTTAVLNQIYGALLRQVDRAGRPIYAGQPAVVAVPGALAGSLLTLVNSEFAAGGTNNVRNIWQNVIPVIEPLLSIGASYEDETGAVDTAAGSAEIVYGFADPANLATVAVAFYGSEAPEITEAREIGVLGTQFRAVLRFDSAVQEWRSTARVDLGTPT